VTREIIVEVPGESSIKPALPPGAEEREAAVLKEDEDHFRMIGRETQIGVRISSTTVVLRVAMGKRTGCLQKRGASVLSLRG
jgi:hypothetical protein